MGNLLSQANTHMHTQLWLLQALRAIHNLDIFVLPSLLQGMYFFVQFSCAATRGQKDASVWVLKYKLPVCSPLDSKDGFMPSFYPLPMMYSYRSPAFPIKHIHLLK